jgi:hypothetical protein
VGHMRHRRTTSRRTVPGPVKAMLIGFALVVLAYALAGASGNLHAGPVEDVLITLVGGLIFGAMPGLLIGTLVTVVGALRTHRRQASASSVTVQDLADRLRRPADVWERMLQDCTRSVRGAEQAVALAPPSPAKDWLTTLHGRMAQELDNAATLTRLARTTFPDEQDTASAEAAAHPLYQQLTQAVADFATSQLTIADIVAGLVARPDLEQVNADLTMLRIQLPVLHEPDLG